MQRTASKVLDCARCWINKEVSVISSQGAHSPNKAGVGRGRGIRPKCVNVIFGINIISTVLGFCNCPHSLRSPVVEVQFPVTTYWAYLSRKDSNNFRALLSLQRSKMMGTDVCPLPIDGWRIFISLLGGVSCVFWLDSRVCCV